MKTLTKVKLINWHSFAKQDICIHKNALITGENGSGKSTVLDALQYVLTVGKCKFNKAANEKSDRTVESYMRWKLGDEGNEYLRKGDITTYIALEFFDELTKRSQIIGVVLDLSSGGRLDREFFQIIDAKIEDVVFIEENKALTCKQFKNKINDADHFMKAVFEDKYGAAKKLLSNALGVSEKYFELVTKAIAFKSIDKVYDFIMQFLLKEDYVDITDLRKSILDYQRIEERLKIAENECQTLNEIVAEYDKYLRKNKDVEMLKFTEEKLQEKQCTYNLSVSEKLISSYEKELENLNRQLVGVDKEYESTFKKERKLEEALQENDGYKLKQTLEQTKKELLNKKDILEPEYYSLLHDLEDERKLLNIIGGPKAFVQYLNNNELSTSELSAYIRDIINYIDSRTKDVTEKVINETRIFNEKQAVFKEKTRIKESLNNKQFLYDKPVQSLINILKEKLSIYYNKSIEVKPLCEYLEVKNEKWRNALEGYLNTQRFDLIIEPEYFEQALGIYEEYKRQEGIYGVGIVDVAKIAKHEDDNVTGTLAEQIEAKNTYAKRYANMILGKVVCVENVRDLRKFPTSISQTAMVYKNRVVRAIHPKTYRTPFIGLQAIELQKETNEKELQALSDEISSLKQTISRLNKLLESLDKSNAQSINVRLHVIDEYKNLMRDWQENAMSLKKVKLDSSIFTLEEEFKSISDKVIQLKNQRDNLNQKIGKVGGDLNDERAKTAKLSCEQEQMKNAIFEKELLDHELTELADNKVIEYQRKYSRRFEEMLRKVDDDYQSCVSKSKELVASIENKMAVYNTIYNIGFANNIEDISSYKSRYFTLRDINVVDKKEKARQARMKCEHSFKTSFISGLYSKIDTAKKDIQVLNKGLSQRDFNGERYEFFIEATKKEHFKDYYKIIMSGNDYEGNSLFSEVLDERQRKIMDELFAKLASVENDKETEKLLVEYTDYRNYLDYDIKIIKNDGNYSFFSKVNRDKSGGETQTPFYVIMAASFEQVIQNHNKNEGFGCVVILDEAFNNMDEHRIREMIAFYNEREIQTFIAVPPSRANTISPYINTNLMTIKYDNCSYVEEIVYEES